jgi:threonyl-tRNA synthetase
MKITFPDGSSREFKKGSTGLEIAKAIGERLAQAALAVEVSGKMQDLSAPIENDSTVKIITFKDKEGVEVFRHSTAHLLAHAIIELFPEAKITVGPAVEEGFYYDIDHPPFKQEDIEKIEKRMKEIVDRKLSVERMEFSKADALKQFRDNPYKVEIIKQVEAGEKITAYKQGNFIDLCRGPHVPNTSYLKAVKITKLAAAYWKGDAKNKQLQRIYGVSFPDKKDLEAYSKLIEEAEKRDHRKIGKEMDLFVFSELVGSGMPMYTPKGFILRNSIVEYSRELNEKIGYQEVHTPNFNKAELFKISGHYEKFKGDMVHVKSNYSNEEFFLKPMNCPQHTQIFASRRRSYRDLPLRYSDFANLCRDEKPGELSGLTRLKVFSQDDAHCFCMKEQVEREFENALSVIKEALKTYGLSYWIRLSLWDPNHKEKYLGDDKTWEESQSMLRKLLQKNKIEFKEALGEAAFYGPKMDIMVKDALGREWQISTIQLDFNMPVRFKLKYDDKDGTEKTPVMVHRAIIGSPERFMGILIEHYAGKFPLWLNPNQVRVLPIADRHLDYARSVCDTLVKSGIRAEVDDRVESTPKKVRDAELLHFNYILVVGDKEVSNKTVNVRTRDNVVQGEKKVDVLLKELSDEIKSKKL